MSNPTGKNQYSKGGGGRGKGAPKLKMSAAKSAAYAKAVNKQRSSSEMGRRIVNTTRRAKGLKRI